MVEFAGIKIIYEDNHLLVVEKPVNMPVCGDESGDRNVLDLLKGYLKVKYKKPGNVYLGLVHRLDRPVGGVMVYAKTSKAAGRLGEQVRNGEMEKVYYAVVRGKVAESGEWMDYLWKDRGRNISWVVGKGQGKEARLSYQRIGFKEGVSLVKIRLETGRSHQIRVQFASHGFPLVGDMKYNKEAQKGVSVALFAKVLSFYHPVTKERMCFSLDLPDRYPFNLF